MSEARCADCAGIGFDLAPCLICDTGGSLDGCACPGCDGEGFFPQSCITCGGGGSLYLL